MPCGSFKELKPGIQVLRTHLSLITIYFPLAEEQEKVRGGRAAAQYVHSRRCTIVEVSGCLIWSIGCQCTTDIYKYPSHVNQVFDVAESAPPGRTSYRCQPA